MKNIYLLIIFFAFCQIANAQLVINEVEYDQPGTDASEFIELKNVSSSAVNLNAWTVQLVNGNAGGAAVYQTITLPNVSLAAGDYYVIAGSSSTVANVDLVVAPATNLIQNGAPDAVGLRNPSATLIDAVSYEGNSGSPYTETSGTGLEDNPLPTGQGIARYPDGYDTNVNNTDFVQRPITPGESNVMTCEIIALSLVSTTPCNSGDNTYTATLLVTYNSAPSSGTLEINGQSFAITSSPQTVTLTGLTADGNPVDVNAYFSADPGFIIDDFQGGAIDNWISGASNPHPPVNNPTGGPAGAADGFLQCEADGASSGGKMTFFNETQWLFDWPANGIDFISVDFKNLGATTLYMRFNVDGPGGRFSTFNCVTVPVGGGWKHHTLEVNAASFVSVGGTDINATLDSVLSFRMVNASGPAWAGNPIVALLGVDNVTDGCVYNYPEMFVAPAACPPVACEIVSLSLVSTTPCVPADNTYTATIEVTYTNPPGTGTLDVNGQSFAITSSPQ